VGRLSGLPKIVISIMRLIIKRKTNVRTNDKVSHMSTYFAYFVAQQTKQQVSGLTIGGCTAQSRQATCNIQETNIPRRFMLALQLLLQLSYDDLLCELRVRKGTWFLTNVAARSSTYVVL
jgi:hypothetical protein